MVKIKILGAHCAEARGVRLTSLLVDDVLALDAGGITSGLSIPEQEKLKAVLLTHHHLDHTRDLATLGYNGAAFASPVRVYGLKSALDVVWSSILDGRVYVEFSKWPTPDAPFIRLENIVPFEKNDVEGYEVVAVPVAHSVPAVGYEVASKEGKRLFYTGDCGPGLSHCWEYVSPQLLVIEVSGPNEYQDFLSSVGHLSPQLLHEELVSLRRIKGYLPHVVVVHLPLRYQSEVEREITKVSRELGFVIDIAYEDMVITL